jgi:phospholipid/cholesterol/gamma-HCH transport system substrate-binding protein
MASERSLEVKVGLLLVVAIAILIGFVIVLGNFSLSSGFNLFVDYDYVGSLQPGAPIKVSGIKVGKIDEVSFWGGRIDDKIGRRVQVRVKAWIEERARESIRADAEYFINTAGVLGEQYLEIVPGRDYARPAVAENAVVRGADPPRTDLVVSRLYEVLDGLSAVLRDDKDVIRDLLKNSASAVGEVNQILVTHREQVGELISATADLAEEATRTLGKVNTGLGDGEGLRGVVRNADATLTSARTTFTTLTPLAATFLGDAARVAHSLSEERMDRAIVAVEKAAAAAGAAGGLIANVDGLVTDLRAGKGTAGALLVREDVYADLREMIRDLKRNPWKFFWKE